MIGPTPNSPCKGCSNRYIGCQAECCSYRNWKIGFEKKKAACREEEAVRYGYHATYFKSYLSERTQECIRKKNKQPGQY